MRQWILVLATIATCLAVAAPGHAKKLTPPTVPTDLEVDVDHRLFLIGHAIGTQNYFCVHNGSAFVWKPFGPQATLFDDGGTQIATHFLSENPDEPEGTLRPTWQHSRDTTAVWANLVAESKDPEFVEPGAISWLKLEVVGQEDGPDAGHRLSKTTFIQRVNTVGGAIPTTGCAEAMDIGKRKLVPYETDYYFYRPRH